MAFPIKQIAINSRISQSNRITNPFTIPIKCITSFKYRKEQLGDKLPTSDEEGERKGLDEAWD